MAVNGEGEGPEARPPPPSMPQPTRTGDFLGKHRLSAAIARLNQEIQFLEKELNELETMETSAEACKEAPRILHGTDGSKEFVVPIVVNGGRAKVLLISLSTGVILADDLMSKTYWRYNLKCFQRVISFLLINHFTTFKQCN
ncbi:uncharacterized protein LOC122001995 isoform X1 [Zingiber officinale]|uniref:uncharacterized protein LOC122001995 isoform X1 n=1 Tax=Zingiber officinale TaxID=94328 RepID=UPI001C4D0818|nr:uncharacterized protein LOC122001995 isoform X1 [Zingiber officinale]